MQYRDAKNPASIKQQIAKLKERGCVISDEKFAAQTLSSINYYRLVHYFAIFLKDKNHYQENTVFEKVLNVYDFDRELRMLCLSVLEELEINFRAAVSNFHALKYGALGYLNPSSFDLHHNHKAFLGKVDHLIEANASEDLVKHHMGKYGGKFPLWVMMEMFSFGALNTFYCDMYPADKKAVAESYGISAKTLENHFQCMADFRNACAHYNRLYDNTFEKVPRPVSFAPDRVMSNTVFDYMLVMKELYKRPDIWNYHFLRKLGHLFFDYKSDIDIALIGFNDDWYEMLKYSY